MAARRPIDNELLTALREGETSALAAVYDRFGGMVYGIALRLTGSPIDAEDVLQEVFVAIPESLGQLRLPSAFAGWLKTLAVRTALNRERAAKRRLRAESHLADPTPEPDAAELAVRRLQLERSIAGLPERLRTVFVLHAVEGFEHSEIAELLGISANASMQRIHRARLLLRVRLGE